MHPARLDMLAVRHAPSRAVIRCDDGPSIITFELECGHVSRMAPHFDPRGVTHRECTACGVDAVRAHAAYASEFAAEAPAMVPQQCQQQQANAGAPDLFAQLAAADAAVKRWATACGDSRKFQPIMRAEYGRAFDRREALKAKAIFADPVRYARTYPSHAYGIRSHLPAGMVARIEAAETDSDMVAAVNGEAL